MMAFGNTATSNTWRMQIDAGLWGAYKMKEAQRSAQAQQLATYLYPDTPTPVPTSFYDELRAEVDNWLKVA